MTDPASGYIPDVIFIGLWGFLAGLASAFGWYSVPNAVTSEPAADTTEPEFKP